MLRKVWLTVCVLCVLLLLAACGQAGVPNADVLPEETQHAAAAYQKISAEEAMQLKDSRPGVIFLDVRTEEEFVEKHIEGAVLLPHTDIEKGEFGVLNGEDPFGVFGGGNLDSNKTRVLLIYCRTGMRSEAAARVLVGLGFTNVYDIGGIEDWPYETVSGPEHPDAPDAPDGEVVITFDHEPQFGTTSHLLDVWIEALDGQMIKSLYSGAAPQPGTLSYTWDLTDLYDAAVPPGEYRFIVKIEWRLTGGKDGTAASSSEYLSYVDGALIWKSMVLYSSGIIALGTVPVTVQTGVVQGNVHQARAPIDEILKQPALTDDAPEYGMISGVTAVFTPATAP